MSRFSIPGIPGVNRPPTTDLPVLKPVSPTVGRHDEVSFSRWLGSLPVWFILLPITVILLSPFLASAQATSTQYGIGEAFAALWRWMPLLLTKGFLMNVVISFLAMMIGTGLGALLGIGQLSPRRFVSKASWFITQLFRNSPWIVLLYIVMLTMPFEIVINKTVIALPDWYKAVFGLSLPIMANISEIVRGAVLSVPTGQWEASESLAFSRKQTLWQIILPQCVKRMIPPWMNWYAILTLATPLCSLLGVDEVLNLTRQAMEAENNRPALLIPFFGFVLVVFFAYCYPIARWTLSLERKFAVKL